MKKMIIIFIILIFIISIWQIWENNSIGITTIKYSNSKIPKEFSGYRIVQISDLHNKQFGENQSKLIDRVKQCNPNIIVITGDLIDDRSYNLETSFNIAMDFINKAMEIAPVYYVTGNHEAYTGEYEKIKQRLIDSKVIVLDNESAIISKNGHDIIIIGLLDPNFYTGSDEDRVSRVNDELKKLSDNEYFKILLSHRPELMSVYTDNKIDLVFSGHTHGGQIRIPFIGGIIGPNQGLFPKYIDGEYVEEDTTMIVSRGLGATIVPIRIFNKPEIILLELQ